MQRFLVHILLILSGTASLVYEIIWVRVLQNTFGNTDLAVTTVLAVFMGGLALGSWLGGKYAIRFAHPVRVYGILELIIALYALAVTPLLYRLDFLYAIAGADPGPTTMLALRFAVCTVLLIIPTICMGATLPILTVPLVKLDHAGEGVGLLYFVNTLGAVVGSALAGFVLIRFLGLEVALYVAAGIGTAVLLVALLLDRYLLPPPVPDPAEAASELAEPPVPLGTLAVLTPRVGGALILSMAFLCGFVSLANEIVWTRMLGFMLDGTVYGFSALLSSFLFGIALGSLFIAPFIDGSRDLWGLFAKVQIMAAIGCVLTILLIPLVPSLVEVFIGTGTGVEGGFALKVTIVFFIILIPCLFFGAAFPIAVTIAARYQGAVSQSLGTVYAANTVGSILGSISGGMILLPLTRDLNTILIMMIFASLTMAIASGALSTLSHYQGLLRTSGEVRDAFRRATVLKGAGLVVLPFLVVVTVGARWPDVNIYQLVCLRYAVEDYDKSLGYKVTQARKQVDTIVWKAQGRGTVVTVHKLSDGGLRLRNNGLNEAYHGPTEPRYADVIYYLGMLPYLLHPNPETALLIGLGGGGTAECLTKTTLKKLTVVELEREVVNASRYIFRTLDKKSRHPGDDPRVDLRVDDGRNALLRTARAKPHQFDLIVSQPSHAWLSGVASLYTREHFGIVRKNLRKGGIFCQWINLFRMDEEGLGSLMSAFTGAFPAVHVFQADSNSLLLIGGDAGLKLDPAVVKRHLTSKAVKDNARLFNVEPSTVFRKYLFDRDTALALARGAATNADRNPVIEMRLPWVLHNDTVKIKQLLERRRLPVGIRPGLVHRSPGWEEFLVGLADDLIGDYDASKQPYARVKAFVDEAAKDLGDRGDPLRARLARTAGDYALAETLLTKAAARGDADTLLALGQVRMVRERYAEAAQACGAAYEKGKRSEAHLCVVEAHFRAGRLAEAAARLDAIFLRKEHDEVPLAHKYMGLLDLRAGRYDEARTHLKAAYAHSAIDDEIPYYLGLLAALEGDHQEARRLMGAASVNASTNADAALGQGKRFAELDHEEGAVLKFREVIRIKRDHVDAFRWMATALRRWGRYVELRETLEAFAKADSSAASSFRASFDQTGSLAERLTGALWSQRPALKP